MALALTLLSIFTLVGLALASVSGWMLSHTGAGAARHILIAVPAVLFSLFTQSMVLFFFIGTGRLVKDETRSFPDADRSIVLRALSGFKRRTSPPATFALLSAIGVFVLGGAVHTRALPSWTHLAASLTAVAVHLWALAAEWGAFIENGKLMADPAAYARSRRASGGSGA